MRLSPEQFMLARVRFVTNVAANAWRFVINGMITSIHIVGMITGKIFFMDYTIINNIMFNYLTGIKHNYCMSVLKHNSSNTRRVQGEVKIPGMITKYILNSTFLNMLM